MRLLARISGNSKTGQVNEDLPRFFSVPSMSNSSRV